jgi:Antitoxin Phd_YefM, type II toxin-antitoxin system
VAVISEAGQSGAGGQVTGQARINRLAANQNYMYNVCYTYNFGSDMRVTTADFIKHYGSLADRALAEPVTITKNGRDRLVVLSAEEYERLKRRDRRVVKVGDLTDEEVALIAKAEVPAEYAHLDEEIKDWHP